MSGKALDCVGGNLATGKHDFQPCMEKPIVFASVSVPTKEARERILSEKVTELAFAQNETCRVTRERNALHAMLSDLVAAKREKDANGESPRYLQMKRGLWERARETLAKFESGELRKPIE